MRRDRSLRVVFFDEGCRVVDDGQVLFTGPYHACVEWLDAFDAVTEAKRNAARPRPLGLRRLMLPVLDGVRFAVRRYHAGRKWSSRQT